MKENENSAFRLYRLVGKMVSQSPSLSTAQVLLNAVGAGDVKGRDQNAVLWHTIGLVFTELDLLVGESSRRNFSDNSRKSIVSAIDRLSILTIGQQWRNHLPAFQASVESLLIFGEGLMDEGPPINKEELTGLQENLLNLRKEVRESTLPENIKEFVYEQLSTIERAIKDYPIAGIKAFWVADRDTYNREREYPEETQAFEQTESASTFNKIMGKVRGWSKVALEFRKALRASNAAVENAKTLAHTAGEIAHQVGRIVHHPK